MELTTPYDALESMAVLQPDKQFLESLKDAMRTIATVRNFRRFFFSSLISLFQT